MSKIQTVDPLEYETLYYYWRYYGNNYPILYKCSEAGYEKYKNTYNGKGISKGGGQYGGL